MTAHHICLLGDANSVHVQRWAREMLARGWRLSLVTARPQAIEGVQQIVLPPVRRATDWLWRVVRRGARWRRWRPIWCTRITLPRMATWPRAPAVTRW